MSLLSQISGNQFADGRDFVPKQDHIFSSAGDMWEGGVLNRFSLHQMPEETYTYTGHMIALPRSGRGRMHWRYHGRSGIAPIESGAVSIQPAGEFDHRCEMNTVICDTLHLDPTWLQNVAAAELQSGHAELCALPHGRDALLVHWMNLLSGCVPGGGIAGASLLAEETLLRIGVYVLQKHGSQRVRVRDFRGGLSAWRLRRVFDFIEANGTEKLPLGKLAEAAGGMSLFYFCRLFHQSTGMTPHQYLLRWRISRAREQLAKRDGDLLQIALSSGFCDHSHLTRCFKRVFGITPSQFQRNR